MRRILAASLAASVAALSPTLAQQSTTFKSGVNLLAVDALVIDRTGQPILGLTPADFVVKINSHARKVVSAELVRHASASLGAGTSTAASPSASLQTPDLAAGNPRVFVLAIDELSFLTDEIKPAVRAAQAFIRKLDPNDMVGVFIYPYAKPALEITHDHALAIAKLDTAMGRRDRRPGFYNLTASDIIDISAGDQEAAQAAALRECSPGFYFNECKKQLVGDAKSIAATYEYEGARRVASTSELIDSLGGVPGHKTLVVLSAGALRFRSALRDGGEWANGLERLAGETGGTLLTWKNGSGELVFDRLLRETSAYYLLGVEPTPDDWDGRTLLVSVDTSIKGATVRALRQVIAK